MQLIICKRNILKEKTNTLIKVIIISFAYLHAFYPWPCKYIANLFPWSHKTIDYCWINFNQDWTYKPKMTRTEPETDLINIAGDFAFIFFFWEIFIFDKNLIFIEV